MPKPRSLVVDLTEADSFLKIFPRSPVRVSDVADWNGIFLAHHRQPAWEMPENQLSQHILSINIGATAKVERVVNGRLQREQFFNGNVAIYPANVAYTLRWDREAEFILLGIDSALLSQTAVEVLATETVELAPILATQDPLIQGMALALKTELESAQVGGRIYVEAIAQTLAIHLLRNYSGSQQLIEIPTTHGLPKHKLQQATDYINDRLEQDLSLSELAALVQMSPFYFARLFKESTGLAPHQFVIRCRVERAKELLMQGHLAIADVATEVGFANQSHLTRHFKRIVGVTPKVVMKNSKNVPSAATT